MSVDGSMKHIFGKEHEFVKTHRDELFAGHLEKKVYSLVVTQSLLYYQGKV